DVEGFYDLRIKARFEYSEGYKALLLNKEMTEGVLGFNLDEAKEMGEDEVLGRIEKLVGNVYEVMGTELGSKFKNFLVKDIRRASDGGED
ncbi:MAG: hypothetical protein V3T58_07810, partial [Candidatus Hydrothermarchaeales archaeon]